LQKGAAALGDAIEAARLSTARDVVANMTDQRRDLALLPE
jgi:hypothetical protein